LSARLFIDTTRIRVALQCFLDNFSPTSGNPINSEDELLKAAKGRRKL